MTSGSEQHRIASTAPASAGTVRRWSLDAVRPPVGADRAVELTASQGPAGAVPALRPWRSGYRSTAADYPSYQRDGAQARTLATGVRHSIAPHPALQDLPRIG